MTVKDGHGRVILTATNSGDDFWTVGEEDLETVKSYLIGSPTALIPERSAQLLESYPLDPLNRLNDPTLEGTILPEVIRPHLTAEERARAKEAWSLCDVLGHPGPDSVIEALNNGIFQSSHLTGQDYLNGRQLFGDCPACVEGKMVAPTEKSSNTEPARHIGDRLHTDLILLKTKSIGGNSVILTSRDEKSGFIIGIPSKSKSESALKDAALATVKFFHLYGHAVRNILTDDEVNLATLKPHLASYRIGVTATPAGLHQKRIERFIRVIKERCNAIRCKLWYELPPELDCELYLEAINCINRLPNSTSGPTSSPQILFTGQKPSMPKYFFGQTGLIYNTKADRELRGEWGIFIGYGGTQKYLRMYNPLTKTVTSKRKFAPQPTCPTAWNLKPRLRVPERKPRVSAQIPSIQPPTEPLQPTYNAPLQVPSTTPLPPTSSLPPTLQALLPSISSSETPPCDSLYSSSTTGFTSVDSPTSSFGRLSHYFGGCSSLFNVHFRSYSQFGG